MLLLASLPFLLAAAHTWPLPRDFSFGSAPVTLVRHAGQEFFRHQAPTTSSVLHRAFARSEVQLFDCAGVAAAEPIDGQVSGIDVVVADAAAPLALGVSEGYTLSVATCPASAACRGRIEADTVYGVLHALRSLSQLVHGCGVLPSAPVDISDTPRFPWRGMMLDLSRHYLPLPKLQAVVDAISECKLNVLHAHLTDAQSFPYLSAALPALAQRGSFAPQDGCASPFNPMAAEGTWGAAVSAAGGVPTTTRTHQQTCTYSAAELSTLVRYAADRGIRTVFEVDTPAHSASWCAAFPGICVSCHSSHTPTGVRSNGSFARGCSGADPPAECQFGYFSLLDPSKNQTWSVIEALVRELGQISGDSFFHIGGDELHWDCWDVPHINAWMATVGIRAGDHKGVARYYLQRIQAIVAAHQMRAVAWNEVLDQYGDADYPPATPAPDELQASTVRHDHPQRCHAPCTPPAGCPTV